MDPNEAYRRLRLAMLAIGVEGGTPSPETCREAFEAWEALDEWMRKSGFPPVAWNNPVTVLTEGQMQIGTVRVTGEVVNGRWTPVNRGGRPPADTSWINTTERSAELDATRSRDLKVFKPGDDGTA